MTLALQDWRNLGGNDFIVTLGRWLDEDGNPGGTWRDQSGTFMHELGHTLGLLHGGDDDIGFKPNYLSIMNPHWQVPLPADPNIGWRLDYSRFGPEDLPSLDESSLNEHVGIGFPA